MLKKEGIVLNNDFNGSASSMAMHRFFAVARLHHTCIEEYVKKSDIDIHRSQNIILGHICMNEGISQKEIAEHFGISPAAVTGSVKALEKAGYVTRESDPRDTRVNVLCPTEKGREVVGRFRSYFDMIDESIMKGIEGEKLEIFNECLGIMEKNITEQLERG